MCALASGVGFPEFLGYGLEFPIPRFAEAADEGLAQETEDGEVEFVTLAEGSVADRPAVQVQPDETAGETLLADGVEGARDGLQEAGTSFAAGFLQGTEAAADGKLRDLVGRIVVIGEHAVFATHDGRHQLAFRVGVGHTLTVHNGLSLSGHLGPGSVQRRFDLADFSEGDGRAGIALDAAGTATGTEVAAELLGKDGRGDQHFPHFKYRYLFHAKLNNSKLKNYSKL